MRLAICFAFTTLIGCNGGGQRYTYRDGFEPGVDASGDLRSPVQDGGGGQMGCEGELQGCYTVYAHSNDVLYLIDLMAKQLVKVGPFNAPMVNGQPDVITDLAVAPDNTIYAVSNTTLYTVSATDGHVTAKGPLGACGMQSVALTFDPNGTLYAADFKGAFCKIDLQPQTPVVSVVGMLSGNLAISGDIVSVGDGTMYGTAYNLSDPSNSGTQLDNYLVKLDPTSAQATIIGSTGYPKLFGVAFALGQVFGFTHDTTGHVVTIDPKSGKGTIYNTFTDPMTNQPITFSGAGVNAMVAPTIM
jgi:hypothetical protein